MNKNFIIVDRANNIQKTATSIIKFTLDGKDYLIYCIDENEENRQIFISRFILNSEGKYFIDNIVPEEKTKLSEIVYNIIILTPTNFKKGENPDILLKNLTEKYKVELSSEIPELNEQEYYNNCSIAITSKELVSLALEFFSTNLIKKETNNISSIPTWELPSSIENPTITAETVNPNTTPVVEPIPSAPVNNTNEPVQTNIENQQLVTPQTNIVPENNINNNQNSTVTIPSVEQNNTPNPQVAIMSDPSLASITGAQPNIAKLNNKGKASVKYIVIGTVCILLAIAVVIVAYILIQKKTTGV